MITLAALARLADTHAGALTHPVAPLTIAGVTRDLDAEPLIMGVVNLSRDSTYRDSVAVSTESAVRRARVLHAQGAAVVDLGAESSTLRASRVGEGEQIATLIPVIESLAADGIAAAALRAIPAARRARRARLARSGGAGGVGGAHGP